MLIAKINISYPSCTILCDTTLIVNMGNLIALSFSPSLLRWPVAFPFCQGFWARSAPGYTRGVRDTCFPL